MDLRLLGPLQVFENGRAVTVGRGRESALLALLAIHANEALATDRIVDELWGESAPENATKSVQIYVSRLRKSLGNDRIETTVGGYLLRLGADELDSARFERLATTGRRQVEGGDAAVGERTLSEALDLWRGEALSDFRFASFAQDEIRRLEEVRANAAADRADAQLAAGQEDAAIPVLRKLIASQPLWERPRRQLMLALYRSGRQAEALELYRETRALFDEELALEPSPALQDLERRILNQDPELGAVSRLPARRAHSRRGALLVAAGGVLIVAAAVAAVAVVATRGESYPALASIAANSLGAIDPSSDRLVAQVALGSSPTAVGVGSRSVWVADANRQQLIAVDPDRLRVQRTVPLASIPTDLAVGRTPSARRRERSAESTDAPVRPGTWSSGGQTWPICSRRPRRTRLHWTTAAGRGRTPCTESWSRIKRGQVRDFDIGRGHSIDGIAFGAGSIWIASSVDDTVIRVDPRTGSVVKTISISTDRASAAGPAALVWGDGSIWVADALADRISRIDPATNTVVGSIAVGTRPTAVAVGAGGLWSLNAGDGSVSHIDPATRRVVATIPVARVVTGLAADAHRVWVTVAGGNAPRSRTPPVHVRPLVTGSCQPMESGGMSPDVLIVSDLPTFDNGGEVNAAIIDMRTAIRAVLKERKFRAGSYRVGYQACTDSSPGASPDPPLCASNAHAFASDASVVGVVGSYQSICSGIELPVLGTGAAGPVAMISPSNTYVGLTHGGPQTGPDEPDRYFPTGVRNYVRLTAPDDAQGAALAELARQLRRHRIYLLDDGDSTSVAMATYVSRAARRLGVGVVGSGHWTAKGPYRTLARTIRATRADAVVLTGCVCTNGAELVTDLRKGLGAGVAFLASDNFTCRCEMSGPGAPKAGYGMYISGAGATPTGLSPAGRRFLRRAFPGRPLEDLSVYVATAAAATEALLRAVASSDGSRASVVGQLTHQRVVGTPMGTVLFDANGDPGRALFTIYRISPKAPPTPHLATQGLVVDRTIEADPGLSAP